MELQEEAEKGPLSLFLGDGIRAEMLQPAFVFVRINTAGGIGSEKAGGLRTVNLVPVLANDRFHLMLLVCLIICYMM